jgi:hypothetical protein
MNESLSLVACYESHQFAHASNGCSLSHEIVAFAHSHVQPLDFFDTYSIWPMHPQGNLQALPFPPNFHIFLHFCLVWFKCSYTYFSIALVFNGESMKNNYASFTCISSHCFGECCLKLWNEMFWWHMLPPSPFVANRFCHSQFH